MATKQKRNQPKLTRTQLAQLRVKDLRRLLPGGELAHGSHSDSSVGPQGVCLMEAVAWVAGEEHSDHPKCACPVLTDIGIQINDTTDDEGRQRLLGAIPALIGSRTSSKRAYFKRSRRAAELVLKHVLTPLKPADKARKASNVVESFAWAQLASIPGQPLTKARAKAFIDSVNYLRDATDDNEIDGDDDITSAQALVNRLHDSWDSSGISFSAYSDILGSTEFETIIPEDELPDFFVEVATQNA